MMAADDDSSTQLQYSVCWFEEFSEMQNSDFLKILAGILAYKYPKTENDDEDVHYWRNQSNRMSLFECRIRLFKKWFPKWDEATKGSFLSTIGRLDPTFLAKLKVEIDTREACNVKNGINHENE